MSWHSFMHGLAKVAKTLEDTGVIGPPEPVLDALKEHLPDVLDHVWKGIENTGAEEEGDSPTRGAGTGDGGDDEVAVYLRRKR